MSTNPLAIELKTQLQLARAQAINAFERSRQPDQLLHTLCANIDHALITAWHSIDLPDSIALIGVGGYGRGEIFPHSDVDLLILLPNDAASSTPQIESLIHVLWDLGLTISHSARTIDECITEAQKNISTKTSLLDTRHIAGNKKLYRALNNELHKIIQPQAFFQEKMLELQQRHTKYEDTPYSLEPNCKESPGGLRDLQIILWLAKAAKLGKSWRELAKKKLITLTEARQLKRTEHAFKDIRIRLHIYTNRCEDRLLFDLQNPIAHTFGFIETPTLRASEVLMQRYYKAAKIVTQLNLILLQNIETHLFPHQVTPQKINARFYNANGLIDIMRDDIFKQYPSAMLEVFLLSTQQAQPGKMTARTFRALWHASFSIDDNFRNNPRNRTLFLAILKSSKGVARTLQSMNKTGILGRYLPKFHQIVGQMQHDLFHAYTVDQHILMVIRNLRRFVMSQYAHEFPFCSQLMGNFAKPWLLYIAALFHDIAKGRGGDHSQLGMLDAKEFCQDHKLTQADTDLIIFLVEHHLTMSQVAQKKDLSDPYVIHAFAKSIQNEQRLTALYLLTVADIRGTSPKVWNAWRGKLLEDLYHKTLRVIGGQAPSEKNELKNKQENALQQLASLGLTQDAHLALWKELDIAYFLRNDSADIVWHTYAFYNKVSDLTPIVICRPAQIGEGVQIAVYVKDHADLFVRLCSYFDQKDISILDAKIHTTRHHYALDTFLIDAPHFLKKYHNAIAIIQDELTTLLTEKLPPHLPYKKRLSRMSRTFSITPSVSLQPDERGEYYLLSISANDRNSLLFTIATILAKYKINLHTAKISTLGERVEDVFLIDGLVLNNPQMQLQFETELLNALSI